MTEPEDHSNTRPISVAELLAKNGSIGAPPVGGRRRRRRGDSNSVTVAELTGEIPIVTDVRDVSEATRAPAERPAPSNGVAHPETDELAEAAEAADAAEAAEAAAPVEPEAEPEPELEAEAVEPAEPEVANEPDEPAARTDLDFDEEFFNAVGVAEPSEAEADYEAHLERRASEDDPVEFAPPRRVHPHVAGPRGGAEQMSPDPVGDHDDDFGDLDSDVDLTEVLEREESDDESRVSPYLRSSSDTLFGGQSVADDLARRGARPGPEDIDIGEDTRVDGDELEAPKSPTSPVLRGVWVVAQCILAVAFGAGLFIAFDLLWKWNNIVALVLSVLVILGLVVGVRVVRKTEDIGSTLIAVAVGALVTLGPLALLQSH